MTFPDRERMDGTHTEPIYHPRGYHHPSSDIQLTPSLHCQIRRPIVHSRTDSTGLLYVNYSRHPLSLTLEVLSITDEDASKQIGDAQIGKPGTGARIVRKRPRINAPMPTLSPRERRVQEESQRLVRLYGTKQSHSS